MRFQYLVLLFLSASPLVNAKNGDVRELIEVTIDTENINKYVYYDVAELVKTDYDDMFTFFWNYPCDEYAKQKFRNASYIYIYDMSKNKKDIMRMLFDIEYEKVYYSTDVRYINPSYYRLRITSYYASYIEFKYNCHLGKNSYIDTFSSIRIISCMPYYGIPMCRNMI